MSIEIYDFKSFDFKNIGNEGGVGPLIMEYVLSQLEANRDQLALAEFKRGEWRDTSFANISQWTRKFATWLQGQGLKPQDKVAILSESSVYYIPSLLGISFTGMVAVPLDVRQTKNELVKILKHSDTKLLIATENFQRLAKELQAEVPNLKTVVPMEGENSVCEFIENLPEARGNRLPGFDPDQASVLIYTSGTTGNPRGVLLTLKNFSAQLLGFPDVFEFGNSRLLSILPLSHVFNLAAECICLFNGSSLYYQNSFLPHELIDSLHKKKITHMIVVPLVLDLLKKGIERKVAAKGKRAKFIFKLMQKISYYLPVKWRRKLFKQVVDGFAPHLQTFISGGAALPNATFKFFESLGYTIVQGYGLTETAPVLTLNRRNERVLGSVGKALKHVELKIEKEDRAKEGLILARGNNVMKGYYKDPGATLEVIDKDGWFNTGDIGYIDRKGNLFITGRAKNLIVSRGGKNIYPEEIEGLLGQCESVAEICVMPYLQKDGNETYEATLAIIYPADWVQAQHPKEDWMKTCQEELNQLRSQLADYKWPNYFALSVEELPKTSSRKIRRHEVKKKINQESYQIY